MSDLNEILKFYREAGVDMIVGEQPNDRLNKPQQSMHPVTTQTLNPVKAMPKKSPNKLAVESREIAAKCQTLDELKAAIEAFDGCPLKGTAINTVFADGQRDAKIMLVGEAPGADEDRQGKPFVGLSGQLLDRMLESIDVSREKNAYITNIIPWRPPGNRQPTTAETTICKPFVERHIELMNPEVLIMVGGVSAKTLLDTTTGIMRLRGQWQEYKSEGLANPIKALALFHPAFLLRSPGRKEAVWQDLLMVKRLLGQGSSQS